MDPPTRNQTRQSARKGTYLFEMGRVQLRLAIMSIAMECGPGACMNASVPKKPGINCIQTKFFEGAQSAQCALAIYLQSLTDIVVSCNVHSNVHIVHA